MMSGLLRGLDPRTRSRRLPILQPAGNISAAAVEIYRRTYIIVGDFRPRDNCTHERHQMCLGEPFLRAGLACYASDEVQSNTCQLRQLGLIVLRRAWHRIFSNDVVVIVRGEKQVEMLEHSGQEVRQVWYEKLWERDTDNIERLCGKLSEDQPWKAQVVLHQHLP